MDKFTTVTTIAPIKVRPMKRQSQGVPDAGELFHDAAGRPRCLRGVSVLSAAPRLAELAGVLGFDTVWIDIEHASCDYTQAEALCISTCVGGAAPAIRVPDDQRHHILRALEIGARLVIVPMVETAQQAKQIIAFGKFPPLGSRGYNSRSRAVAYGTGDVPKAFANQNRDTHLFAQIETVTGTRAIEEICAVKGLSGIFIGPGDLSASMGRPGDLDDQELIDLACHCITTARRAGKHAGILVKPGRLLDAATEAGANLVFAGCDLADVTTIWRDLLDRLPAMDHYDTNAAT